MTAGFLLTCGEESRHANIVGSPRPVRPTRQDRRDPIPLRTQSAVLRFLSLPISNSAGPEANG